MEHPEAGGPEFGELVFQVEAHEAAGVAREQAADEGQVVLAAHLLGEEVAAVFQDAADFGKVVALVAGEDQVEAVVREGQGLALLAVVGFDGDAQGGQALLAQRQVGGPALGDAGEGVGVAQGEEKLPAAGAHVQQPHPGL